MKPALLHFPYISSYPVLLLLGFFFGWLLARRRGRLFGINGKDLDNIALLLPLAGLFGARFFARLFYEKVSLVEALRVWEGDGLVFYGGFLFGIAAVFLYGLIRRLNLCALADCLAPSLPLGLAFGRVGCFLAGCCWGDACGQLQVSDSAVLARIQTVPSISQAGFPLAVSFPSKSEAAKQHVRLGLIPAEAERSLPVHPVQLYEAALAAFLSLGLHVASRGRTARNIAGPTGAGIGSEGQSPAFKKEWTCSQSPRTHRIYDAIRPGSVSIAMLLGYASIRFCTEYLRADNKPYLLAFTFSQVVSICIGVVCVVLLAARAAARPASPTTGRPEAVYAPSCSSH